MQQERPTLFHKAQKEIGKILTENLLHKFRATEAYKDITEGLVRINPLAQETVYNTDPVTPV